MIRSRAGWWLSAGACLVFIDRPAGRETDRRGGGNGQQDLVANPAPPSLVLLATGGLGCADYWLRRRRAA
jgi:hypothetical protein